MGSGEVTWLPETRRYRASTSGGSSASESEGSLFPNLRWEDLPAGAYEIVVTTESGATTTRATTVRKAAQAGEGPAPVVIDY